MRVRFFRIASLAVALIVSSVIYSQVVRRSTVCNLAGPADRDPLLNDSGDPDDLAQSSISRVRAFLSIPENTYIVRSDRGWKNFGSDLMDGKWYIVYDPDYVADLRRKTKTEWAIIAAAAHEIAHHVLGHTKEPLDPRLPEEEKLKIQVEREREADRFAGATVAKMQGPRGSRDEALALIPELPDDVPGYPPRIERLTAARAGWEEGHRPPPPVSAKNMNRTKLSPLYNQLKPFTEGDWRQLTRDHYVIDQISCPFDAKERELKCSLGEGDDQSTKKIYDEWWTKLREALPAGWQVVENSKMLSHTGLIFYREPNTPEIVLRQNSPLLSKTKTVTLTISSPNQ